MKSGVAMILRNTNATDVALLVSSVCSHYLYLSQLIHANRKRRIVLQVPLNYALARRIPASWGLSSFAIIDFQPCISLSPSKTEHLIQKRFLHFKQVYLVAEKQEPRILDSSMTAILLYRAVTKFLHFSHACLLV